ncbi:uncharacterized protein LOC121738221 [Aricia agestis]|uniref:uncharacterized protein LOC121738221 n=1 Tax=Aricia agestis TaxID=91739 RepID=UPI001C2047E2|nr:uncharacterized protein LOC121738221 [Aricia agestis]
MKSSLRTALILLVPCLISAQIQVEIVPGSDDRNPDVVVSGTDRAKASDNDLQAFGLTLTAVKSNLMKMQLKWKTVGKININFASVSGYRDLYVTLRPKSERVLRTNDEIVKYRKRTYRNNDRTAKELVVERDVTESLTTKWFETRDLSLHNSITHIVQRNSLEHSSRYGQQGYAHKAVTIEAEPEEEVELQPGESVKAELQMKKTTVEVRIDYEVSLDGDIYFGYFCGPFGHICLNYDHLDINEYFMRIGQSSVLETHEILTYVYYHDPQLKVAVKQRNTESTLRPGY